ncbi:MAG: M48 family metallopeptidase [Nevskiales bacterium]
MPAAAYYDGKTARRHEVRISFAEGSLLIEGDGIQRHEPLSGVRVSERLGQAPRLLSFGDGAHCEVRDHAALEVELAAAGHRQGLVERLQRSRRAAGLSLLLCAVTAFAAYRWGIPLAAEVIAARMPPAVSRQLSDSTLQALDHIWLEPTKLDAPRREALSRGFMRLHPPAEGGAPLSIEFRSSPKLGPNAFALPDGRLVLLDQLVTLAGNDEEIYGVLAHELGHVHYHHGMRMLLQGSAVALLLTAWVGDVSSLLASLPAGLLQARYSRDFEAQADDYAAATLLANGIPPSRLADLLERLVAHRDDDKKGDEGDKDSGVGDGGVRSYLSSHPATSERIRRLRQADSRQLRQQGLVPSR